LLTKPCYNQLGMAKYPIFLELADRRVVVIGGGPVATRKACSLLEAGARVVIVAEKIDEVLAAQCKGGKAELITAKYSKDYLVGAVLAIAATNDPELNQRIYKDCQELEILCNVVDQPQLCDFFVPAVIKRGRLQIAISTDGQSPAYAGHLRKKLEQLITEEHGQFVAELEKLREHIIQAIPNQTDRKTLLGRLVDDESFDYFVKNGPAAWRDRAVKIIDAHRLNE